jgi:hypothetical protein
VFLDFVIVLIKAGVVLFALLNLAAFLTQLPPFRSRKGCDQQATSPSFAIKRGKWRRWRGEPAGNGEIHRCSRLIWGCSTAGVFGGTWSSGVSQPGTGLAPSGAGHRQCTAWLSPEVSAGCAAMTTVRSRYHQRPLRPRGPARARHWASSHGS